MNPPEQSPASPSPSTNPAPAAPTAPGTVPAGTWGGGLNAIKQAYAGIMANPAPAGIYVAVSFVVGALFALGHPHVSRAANYTEAGGTGLVSLIFIRALVLYSLSIADKKPLSVSEFFSVDVKQFIFLILAYISVFVVLLIAAIPIFIPWIWVVPWLAFTGYALVDKNLAPFAAMGTSRHLASNHKGKFWGIVGWMILVSIAGAIVGIIPYVSYLIQPAIYILEFATLAILYRYLTLQPSPAAAPTAPVTPAAPTVAAS